MLLCAGRSQFDNDDEVRDRATFYLNVLNEQQKALNLTYIINGRLQRGRCLGSFVIIIIITFNLYSAYYS